MATTISARSMETSTGIDAAVSTRRLAARLSAGLAKAGAPSAPSHALVVVAALLSMQGALLSTGPHRGLPSHDLVTVGLGNNNGNGNVGTGNGNGNTGNNNGNNNVGNGNGNFNSGNNNGNSNIGNNDGNGNSGNNNGNRNVGNGIGNGKDTDNNGNGMLLQKK